MTRSVLREKLNRETARIGWPELERHFARGVVLVVSPALDLVDVAAAVAEDDAQAVRGWTDSGALIRATDEHARVWVDLGPQAPLWAVVVAPWVLVQEAAGAQGAARPGG
ncbi:MAG: DUF2288 family protein [Chromatiales bacterium]|jgi:hypothetical protein